MNLSCDCRCVMGTSADCPIHGFSEVAEAKVEAVKRASKMLLNQYRVRFRDFVHNRVEFTRIVQAENMNQAVDVARIGIQMPAYVICDLIQRDDSTNLRRF